ncbi:hypothetical protein CF15_07995 [Pyrodictium occultum]|uniref:Uncharacterized protein n=1 Tax=Pyrodictium occultum TaxID=2309 RepID=A0A0V8RRF8_PYROC|nr:hypothetical protein [Pyrodictium occultum]KSW10716.1 hypothetical protein CF15_07995 [Pyrodictium occultum]
MGAEKAQLVVEALRRYDPGAQGLLASNETLAAEAVAWMVEKQGKRLPFTPEQLVEMLHSREALKRIVAGELRRQVLARTPENMTGTVEGMLDTVIREGP